VTLISTSVLSVGQSVTELHSDLMCKTAELIKVLFGVDTWGCKEHCVRRGSRSITVRGGGSASSAAKLLWVPFAPSSSGVVKKFAYYCVGF